MKTTKQNPWIPTATIYYEYVLVYSRVGCMNVCYYYMERIVVGMFHIE